jgi:hypothetical protein
MGNRLITVLAFLNALGLFGCMILMAGAISRDPTAVMWVTQALRLSVRVFVVGCALAAVAWGISAMEMNRANDRVRMFESWALYLLLLVSLGLFFVGSWRVPDSLLAGVSLLPPHVAR